MLNFSDFFAQRLTGQTLFQPHAGHQKLLLSLHLTYAMKQTCLIASDGCRKKSFQRADCHAEEVTWIKIRWSISSASFTPWQGSQQWDQNQSSFLFQCFSQTRTQYRVRCSCFLTFNLQQVIWEMKSFFFVPCPIWPGVSFYEQVSHSIDFS